MADGRERERIARGGVLEKVLGAIAFGLIFLGTLVLGALPFAIGMSIVALIGAIELFSIFETKGESTPTAAVIGILAAVAYVMLAHYEPIESFGYVTFFLVMLSFAWYMIVLRHVKPTKAIAMTIFVPLLTGFCLAHLVLLRDFAGLTNPNPNNGFWVIIFIIVVIWIYDIFAWMIGRKIGRHKMAPSISPNKSWEGTAAGTVGALAGAVVLRQIIQWILGANKFSWFSIWVALAIGAIVCVLGPLGDLSESLMKREYGVKDTGKLIPGAGGIMDRFDSTMLTAPAVFYFLYYFVFK